MKRKIERKLQAWKSSKNRKPLILKGIRQCGKTYLLKSWGKKAFARIHYLNFEQNSALMRIFETDFNTDRILNEVSFFLKTTINTDLDLIVFDEIQACERALTSLKYFNEDRPEVAIIAAGSLLGVQLGKSPFPVGKIEMLSMHPLSFEEFLMALGEDQLLKINSLPVPEFAHARLWECLTWYFVTGGLPEVVQTFVDILQVSQEDRLKNLFRALKLVRLKQKQLLLAYQADFAKHCGKENAMHIDRVFQAVPTQLAAFQDAQAKRFQFSHVIPGIDRYAGLVGAIDWLTAAGLVLPTSIASEAEFPLSASIKPSLFKLYLADIGLLGAMADLPSQVVLDQKYGTYKGYFAENFVAQELVCSNALDDESESEGDDKLICWQKERSEIEFIRIWQGAVIPIEVKSGKTLKAKSLEKFQQTYQPPISILLNGLCGQKNLEMKKVQIPLYFAGKYKTFL